MLCSYGCGKEAIYFFPTVKKWCCSKKFQCCQEVRRNQSEKMSGRTKETHEGVRKQAEKMRGRTKETYDSVRRMAETKAGKTKENDISKRNTSELIKILWKDPNSKYNSKECRKKKREYMKNGHAAFMCSCIKDDSKPEKELWKLTCKIAPYVIRKYPVYRIGKGKRSYNIDIAIPYLRIAIEYDGYYHFNTKKAIEYHKKRQQEIEQEGWKFLRYNIFQPFPTLEKIREDIQKILCQI